MFQIEITCFKFRTQNCLRTAKLSKLSYWNDINIQKYIHILPILFREILLFQLHNHLQNPQVILSLFQALLNEAKENEIAEQNDKINSLTTEYAVLANECHQQRENIDSNQLELDKGKSKISLGTISISKVVHFHGLKNLLDKEKIPKLYQMTGFVTSLLLIVAS